MRGVCAPSPSAAVGPLPPVPGSSGGRGSLWPDNDGGRPPQPTSTVGVCGVVRLPAMGGLGCLRLVKSCVILGRGEGSRPPRGGAVLPRRPRRRRRGVEDRFTKATGHHPPRTAGRGLHWPIARTRRTRRSTPRGSGVDTPPGSNGHPVRGPPSPTLGRPPPVFLMGRRAWRRHSSAVDAMYCTDFGEREGCRVAARAYATPRDGGHDPRGVCRTGTAWCTGRRLVPRGGM